MRRLPAPCHSRRCWFSRSIGVAACLIFGMSGQPAHTDEAPGEVANVTVYQIWARQSTKKHVPKELAEFEQILIDKTKKKKYSEFRLRDPKRPATKLKLKLDKPQEVKLPQDYRTEFTAVMDAKKKCVLKVLLKHGKDKSEAVIRRDTSLMLLPNRLKKDGWNMVLLIHSTPAAK